MNFYQKHFKVWPEIHFFLGNSYDLIKLNRFSYTRGTFFGTPKQLEVCTAYAVHHWLRFYCNP